MRVSKRFLLLTLGSLSISACSSTQMINFSVIQQSNQCHIQAAKITSLSSESEQAQFIKRYSLFKTPETNEELVRSFAQHSEDEKLFIISQGTKSSAGYGFEVQGEQATLNNHTLVLPITLTSPAKDAYLAQVMTSPCLVVGIDSKANYQSIVVDGLELKLAE